jgi:hypothetical protein
MTIYKTKNMKNIVITFIFVFCSFFLFAQNAKNQKIEPIGDLLEVTIYYDNGAIMQHGFMTLEKELHASWESFYQNGNRKCVATYDHGKKVGTWFYWFMDKKTRVVYKDNEIVEVVDLPLE